MRLGKISAFPAMRLFLSFGRAASSGSTQRKRNYEVNGYKDFFQIKRRLSAAEIRVNPDILFTLSDAHSYRYPSIFLWYYACIPASPPNWHAPAAPSPNSAPLRHSSDASQKYAATHEDFFYLWSSPAPGMPAQPCTHIGDTICGLSDPPATPPYPAFPTIHASASHIPAPPPPTPRSPVSPAPYFPFPTP